MGGTDGTPREHELHDEHGLHDEPERADGEDTDREAPSGYEPL